jgi:hypothetical protein
MDNKLHFVILSNSRCTECFFIDEETYEWVNSPPGTNPPLKIQTKFDHLSLKRKEPLDISLLKADRLSDLFIIAEPPIFYDEFEAVKYIEDNNIEIISQVSSIIF